MTEVLASHPNRPSSFAATLMPRTRRRQLLHTGSRPWGCSQVPKASGKRRGSQGDPELSAGRRSVWLALPRGVLEGRLDKDDGSQLFAEFLQHNHPLQEHLVADPVKRLQARQGKGSFPLLALLPFPPPADKGLWAGRAGLRLL